MFLISFENDDHNNSGEENDWNKTNDGGGDNVDDDNDR